jgi:thioester reductase-like protein
VLRLSIDGQVCGGLRSRYRLEYSVLTEGSNVFVTGATGLIGGELVRTLITQPVGKVWALVRPMRDAAPAIRLAERLQRSGLDASTIGSLGVRAVAGDVSVPRLGLSDSAYDEICREADIIIHSAAETSFIRAAACRRTNIAGAENLIEFTRSCTRQPLLVCLSTAYVSGVVANTCISEDDFRPQNEHHNEYTRSKAVAEELVRGSGLPVLVVRPSVVLSAGVPDPMFARAILGFVPMLKELDAVPVNPAACPDVVPVQFVVDSLIRLLQKPHLRHDCYHISAGECGAANYEQLCRVVDTFYGRTAALRLVAPAQWTRAIHRQYIETPHQRKVFASLRNYLPFLNMNVLYDCSRLRQELGERFTPAPLLTTYLSELLGLVAARHETHRLSSGASRA